MIVYLKLNTPIGSGYGTSFTLTANAGTIIPTTATVNQLTAGILVDVSIAATSVTLTSLGTCNTPIVLPINRTTTTTTILPTTTTTTTAACVPTCGAIYMTGADDKLYYYNLISPTVGISTPIQNPSLIPISGNGDIANTATKFFITDCIGNPYNSATAYGKIVKYDFTLCPVSFSNPVVLTTPAGKAPLGLCAKDNNTLISTRLVSLNTTSGMVIEIDVNSGVVTDKFSLDTSAWRVITGDVYYVSSANILYVTNSVGANSFITSYNYSTGAIINDVNINAISTGAYGVSAINDSIYIFNATGAIYRIDSMLGAGVFTRMPDGVTGIGAATTPPGCGAPLPAVTSYNLCYSVSSAALACDCIYPTTTTSTSTTTTTAAPTPLINYTIGGGFGAKLEIIRVSDGAVVFSRLSSDTLFTGTYSATYADYIIKVSWYSGSGNTIRYRICNVNTRAQIYYTTTPITIGGTNSFTFTPNSTVNRISVNVQSQNSTVPNC